ncbi:sialate O-acetylesterase [Filimonas lacunae]|uniref:Sialate O-acetylesterase n=1 Tax=Filimonas lacunae TaxID=477680 RepID=A0A173MH60_9BACT|nr:sialate O-acetylesterase [Filimonas lacunae]BAV06817.1 sialic acid-specific 9-O-acetylesterase [Filimonas lacunae]SIS99301.1 sialate O-acetylesterase [Filimonas lacunae]
MKKNILLLLLSAGLAPAAWAQIQLPRLIRDSMVLQREQPIQLWGWAAPGEKVSIRFAQQHITTRANTLGKWNAQLPAMKAGGPYTMQLDASNHITLNDILIGDVWLCSGQSNMVHQMALHAVRYASEVATANNPQIRHFWVPNTANMQGPQNDLPGGSWKWANPKDVGEFSAVAYFFAQKIYAQYHVPIGLINASWGGTPLQSWMSEEGFQPFPQLLSTLQQNKDTAYVNGISRAAANRPKPEMPLDKGMEEGWFNTSYAPKGWRSINIPGYWEDQGIRDLDGVVWYRREIDVPAAMTTAAAKVFLGRIVDADALYINGKQVGNTTYLYPQRRYPLPAGTLHAGKNLFVIRVTNNAGKGGFVPDKPYQLIAGNDTIDLKGTWQYKVGLVNNPPAFARNGGPGPAPGPGRIAPENQPAALFNAMIAPLIPFSLKGFLWYQGETDTGHPKEYAHLQPALIANWRSKWKQPTKPFLYVQLPGFMDMSYRPMESNWAAFREAQLQSLQIPHTGMAVAIDLGEWNDIHPDRKKEVGERLALAAQHVAYGDSTVVYSGPLFQAARIEGDKIILSFTNTGSGLTAIDDGPLSEFAIAGADKKFVWAKATIEGNTIVVQSPAIRQPQYVRYAWADNPVNPNLYNKEGLPASPFRTDNED